MKPSRIHVSIGTAAVLRLTDAPAAVPPTTAYLMLGGRCRMDCAFCAQARQSRAGSLHLSRVTWPEYDLQDVTARLAGAARRGEFRRACLQVTAAPGSFEQALAVVRSVRARSDMPFDVALLPDSLDQVRQLVRAGADHIGFGLDAACEPVFRQVKGGNWPRSLALIEETARAFPGRAAVHLIVGLGETERELAGRVQWAHDLGATVGLFAFTPVRGTRLEALPAPPLASYRRLQAARWLIAHDRSRVEEMAFDGGARLVALGADLPLDGEPFRTSGCPDCNRPFYNERPGGVMYNYARPLAPEEAAQAVREMAIEQAR